MTTFVQPQNYKSIGTVKKIRGLDGHMIIRLNYPDVHFGMDIVFFHVHHTYVPYRVASWQAQGKFAQITLEHITDRTQAQTQQHHILFADAALVEKTLAQTDTLIGYAVIDQQQGVLGEVVDVEKGMQTLLYIALDNDVLMVPLHDVFIQEIDKETRTITTQLPDNYAAYL